MTSEQKNGPERKRRILRHYPLVLILCLILTALCLQLKISRPSFLTDVLFGASALISCGMSGLMFPFLYWVSGSAERDDKQ